MKILKKVANINLIVTKKKTELISFSFSKIKYVSIRYSPIKKLKN